MNGGSNPYGYVGGNPINWIDPLGLVQVDPDTGLVFSDLAPNLFVDPAFRNSLSYIESIPTGQELLQQLQESGGQYDVYTISKCDAESESNFGRAFINPKFNPGIVTSEGIQRIQPHVVLLHELAHLLTGPVGDLNGPQRPRNPRLPTYKNRYGEWEMHNIVTPWENPAREEFGLPERTQYYSSIPPTCFCR